MPAPIAISVNEQDWIKQYLQETYDVIIVDAFDCTALSEAIYLRNGIKISYSTFRRIFNLVRNTNSHSRFVLNALAVAVGFNNWELFKQHVASFDTNVINQNIQVYSRQLPGSSALILETIKKLPLSTWMGGYQLQSIITIAIENNDFELLQKVVHLPFEIEQQNVYEHFVIGFQSLYFQSIKGNTAIIGFVTEVIADSVLLQKCLLQAYVDEKYVDKFLGEWLIAIHDSQIPDMMLFKNLLLCQKSVNSNDIPIAKIYLKQAQKLAKEPHFAIHPILKARLGVWEEVLTKKDLLSSYFSSLNGPFEKADFAVIGSRLLWVYQNSNAIIPFLDQISINEFPAVKDFFQKGRYNILILTLAINYYIKQEYDESKAFYKLFNNATLGYDIVNIDFYLPWIDRLNSL